MSEMPEPEFVRFELVDDVRETDRGLVAELHGEQLRIEMVRPDVVRVQISRGGRFDETPTYAVCVDPFDPTDPFAEPVAFHLVRDTERVRLVTPVLTVSLGLDPFRLDVHRADGSPVLQTATDEQGRPWAYATLNDAWTLRRRCLPEDAIYGLGEKTGRHNRKGRDFTLWNVDVQSPGGSAEFTAGRDPDDPRADKNSVEFDPYYVSIPFFYHHDYPTGQLAASFVDNGYRGHYDFTEADSYALTFDGGQYIEYVFAGPEMPAILDAYTWLTGRAALPPMWALGYHQSRWFGYTQAAVEAIGQRHRALGIPCDTLWFDIEYMAGYRVFTWDPDRFPDLEAMLRRLGDDGFRVVTIIDPGVKCEPGYAVFDAGRDRDAFCRTEGGDSYLGQAWPGLVAFPDFVEPDARDWWAELTAAHVTSGVAGIWNDMNEPATGDVSPAAMRFGRGRFPHDRYHNSYGLLMAMATAEGLRRARPNERPFVLSRAGSAGIQRYAANWLGDNSSRWDHLRMSLAMAAGFGVSGQPFVGADIGGFQGNTTPELFLRWMQYGVLTPFCRNHSEMGHVDQYAWSFGEVVQDLVRAAIELRYRLLPYLYAGFVRASETGAPVQRPLVFDNQHDEFVRDLDGQYLLGPDLLVAPVLEPGCTARQVYLPAGQWYDWATRSPVGGRRFLRVDTPMDAIPVFARGGAVIPMWPTAPASTHGYHPEEIELHLFVPADGTRTESLLVEDDGLTAAAEQGAYLRTMFTVTRSEDEVRVGAEVTGGGYPEFVRQAFRLYVHGAAPASVNLDGSAVTPQDGAFRLLNAGTGFTVTMVI